MIIRLQRSGDDVGRLIEAAFARPVVARLATDLAGGPAHLVSLVAVDDEELVGHVQCSIGWLDAPSALVEVAVLSPLSVSPGRQRRGIGSALVGAALRACADAGMPAVFLEGDPAFYRRVGFRPGADLGCTPPSVRIPPAAFQVRPTDRWSASQAGALVYPDAFWRRDCVGLR